MQIRRHRFEDQKSFLLKDSPSSAKASRYLVEMTQKRPRTVMHLLTCSSSERADHLRNTASVQA
jgi:hypothetical protein